MLHFIFQSPVETATLERMGAGDVAVFFENALFRLLKGGTLAGVLSRNLGAQRYCVLADDLAVRGIRPDELIAGLEVIDYAELVRLTVENPRILSWM